VCVKAQCWLGPGCVSEAGLCGEGMRLLKFPAVEPQLLGLPALSVVLCLLMLCGSQNVFLTVVIVCNVACEVWSDESTTFLGTK
jgi:hypothetical protein